MPYDDEHEFSDEYGYDDGDHGEYGYGDDDPDYITCPNCRADVYEDAPACPVCGEYVTRSSHPFAGRPNWWIILGLIGILFTIIAMAGVA